MLIKKEKERMIAVKTLKVGTDNPFTYFGVKNFKTAQKKRLKLRTLDTYTLIDIVAKKKKISFEAAFEMMKTHDLEIWTIDSSKRSVTEFGKFVMIGIEGETYFNDREVFVKKNFILNGRHVCDNDDDIQEITIHFGDDNVSFTPQEIKENFPAVHVMPDVELVQVVQVKEHVKVETSWGTQDAFEGDYIIVRNKADFYRHCGKLMHRVYNIGV